MSDGEVWVRVLLLVPLAVITGQILLLRRLLDSPAWNLLSMGFVISLTVRALSIVVQPFTIPALIALLVAYTLIGAGFYVLRSNLLRILRRPSTPANVPRNRRAEDRQRS